MELGTLLYRTWTFDKYGHYACSFWPWRFLRKIWPSSVFHKELFWKCWFYYWDYISCDVMRKRLDKIRWSSEKLALKRQHMCCCSLQSYYWLLFHSVDSRKGMKVFYGFSEILKIFCAINKIYLKLKASFKLMFNSFWITSSWDFK